MVRGHHYVMFVSTLNEVSLSRLQLSIHDVEKMREPSLQ